MTTPTTRGIIPKYVPLTLLTLMTCKLKQKEIDLTVDDGDMDGNGDVRI